MRDNRFISKLLQLAAGKFSNMKRLWKIRKTDSIQFLCEDLIVSHKARHLKKNFFLNTQFHFHK